MGGGGYIVFLLSLLLFLFAINVFIYADENSNTVNSSLPESPWYENIFFTLSGQYYLIPPLSMFSPEMSDRYGDSKGIIPYPGFRVGAGYEWNKWLFGLESGYTYIKGDNPIVTKITLVPLLIKAGYTFNPISGYDRFNLTPTAAFGFIFSSVDHYKDAIDILTENLSSSSNAGFLFQAGVRAGWSPFVSLDKKLEIFAGFSVDCIPETDGLIPLPQIEIGVILRPFLKTKKAETPVIVKIIEEVNEEEIIAEEIIYEETEIEEEIEVDEEIEEETEIEIVEPVFKKQVWIIYFSPDVTVPTGNEINALKEAASAFGEYIEAKITIHGYAAPLKSSLGHKELSRRRAMYCESYLTETCEIPKENIKTEWFGADAMPGNIEKGDYHGRRITVITIEGWINP